VEKINPLKALKDPSHSGTISRLIELIGNGLGSLSQLAAKQALS
jgi:hypothetical protein